MCAGLADHVSNAFALVAVEIVHDDDVTRPERWQQDLFDIGFEAVAIDRATDGEGGCHAVKPQSSNKGYGFPMARRHLAQQGLALLEPAPEPGHVVLHPCFVDEDKPRWFNARLILAPPVAPSCDVGAVLFGGVNGFF